MKNTFKLIFMVLAWITCASVFAQTRGFNYQAIISTPKEIIVPGTNLNYLSTSDIALRFSIYNHLQTVEYSEEHELTTGVNGEVNLIIGLSDSGSFNAIQWDGSPKQLQVEVDYLDGEGYQYSNTRSLLYLPHPFSNSEIAPHTNKELIDAMIIGAGFDSDGNYIPNPSTYYIHEALSLMMADKLLDAQIQANELDISVLNSNNSDDQILSFDSLTHTLTLEDGGTVNLSHYQDNTDNQTALQVPLEEPLDLNGDGNLELNVEQALRAIVDTLFACKNPTACNYETLSVFNNEALCLFAESGYNCEGLPITIGMEYQGGYVISYNETNHSGLIVSKEDMGDGLAYDWGCYEIQTNANATQFGMGQSNTEAILSSMCSQNSSAANVCNSYEKEGYIDWYLPSKDELSLIYTYNTILDNQPGFYPFQTDLYWSSSELISDLNKVYVIDFSGQESEVKVKSTPCYVRAVRSF